jgi:hypothetical protein
VVVARSLTVLALLPFAALAQKPVPVRLDIPSVKKAVVTIHALDASGEAVASGTGFFVTGGSVVTAAHVLQGAAACSVELSDGQTMRCSVAASDTGKDVVMLLVGGQPPATLRWGTSDDAKDGDEITVVSNPLGELPGTVSKGIVSASRVVSGTKLIQISAAISHGSSGAPVLDSHGQVIGIVRSTISEGQSLNFATATDAVRYMLNSPSAVAEAQGFFSKPAAAAPAPVTSAPAAGGQGRRTIQVGQSVNSTLSSSDESYSDSTYYQRWYFTTRPNTAITLDLASDDFDPVLLLSGLDSTVVDVRHRGPGCAARISLVFPGAGPYSVVANTSVTPVRQTGRYTLSLTQGIRRLLPDDDCSPATSSSPSAGTGTMHQIQVGQAVNGNLTTDDNLYRDTTYYQFWQFTATAGSQLTVDLSSDDFDPYLIVRGFKAADGRDSSSVDDDGGPGCSARVSTTFPTTGTYTILVNTTSTQKKTTGGFTLSITRGLKPPVSGDCSNGGTTTPTTPTTGGGGGARTQGTMTIGQSVQGRLATSDYLRSADTTYAQWWLLQGRAGQQVTIDLESDDFDSFIFLFGPGLTDDGSQDDDSGGNCNSRLTVTMPQSGEYRILVNTRNQYETGAYTLSVTAGSKPKSLQRCSRR